jgi:hypothetical protein
MCPCQVIGVQVKKSMLGKNVDGNCLTFKGVISKFRHSSLYEQLAKNSCFPPPTKVQKYEFLSVELLQRYKRFAR